MTRANELAVALAAECSSVRNGRSEAGAYCPKQGCTLENSQVVGSVTAIVSIWVVETVFAPQTWVQAYEKQPPEGVGAHVADNGHLRR